MSVSFMFFAKIITDNNAEIDDTTHKVVNPNPSVIRVPKAGPTLKPMLLLMPKADIASPRRSIVTTSATYAAVAVGLKPVEKPCAKRKSKNPKTVVAKG